MRLIETLFSKKGYNPLIRPVRNLTETVTVKFGLAMIQLINVVCVTQISVLLIRSLFSKSSTFHGVVVFSMYIVTLLWAH